MAEKNQWYKHYPLDFYHGTEDLSIEEIGAYQLMLNLIYARQGPVADNDKFIAGHMRVSTRKWRAFRKRLLETGKLFLEDGKLMNLRAQTELENCAKAARRQREHGAKGARTRDENRARANKNKDLNQGTLKQPDIEEDKDTEEVITPEGPLGENPPQAEPDLFADSQAAVDPPPEPPDQKPKKSNSKRVKPHRLPDDWQPDAKCRAYAEERGFVGGLLDDLVEDFRAHWLSATGKGSARPGWGLTWKAWVRREIKMYGVPTPPNTAQIYSINGGSTDGQGSAGSRYPKRTSSQGDRHAAFLAGAARILNR